MWRIKSETAESIIHAAKSAWPDEFLCLLGGEKEEKLVDELVIVPAVFGRTFSFIRTWLVPFDPRIVGSVHSHPGHSNRPSGGDKNSFPRFGEINLIICQPYGPDTLKAYDLKGNEIGFKII